MRGEERAGGFPRFSRFSRADNNNNNHGNINNNNNKNNVKKFNGNERRFQASLLVLTILISNVN